MVIQNRVLTSGEQVKVDQTKLHNEMLHNL
jgi:hypothetical protein